MRYLVCQFLALIIATNAFAWGQKGHDVVAYIAENHLSPAVAQKVTRVLEGHSLVYYANWLDNASHTPDYYYTLSWHYANVDRGHTYATMPRNERGDVVTAITLLVRQLESKQLTAQQENIALRMLIHLVGDLHCPMHAGRKSDLGGNKVTAKFFDRKTNLHSIWDTSLLEAAHKWTYTEWQQQIDRLDDEAAATATEGSVEDWFAQTHAIACEVYDNMPKGRKFAYNEIARYAPVIEKQLLYGGLRLAFLLEQIYGE